jgi:hypothetical protein
MSKHESFMECLKKEPKPDLQELAQRRPLHRV